MRFRLKVISGIAVGLGAVIAGVIFFAHRGPGTMASEVATRPAQAIPSVSVVRARREDLTSQLTLAAELRPFQEINLYARVAGYVRQMKVDVGDRVKAGEVLAVLEIPELDSELLRATAATERATQEVVRAKAAYDEAHLTFDRLSEVLKQQPNLVAQQEIDQARARDETLHASWIAAQSAEREARANETKFRSMVAFSRITAPFAGVITHRFADTGSLVGAGTGSNSQALVRLSQFDPLRLVLPVPESSVPKVRVGTPVGIVIPAIGRTLSATVTRSSGRVATETRTMHVEVDVANPGLALAPGMYATAVLGLETRKQALSIPVEALQERKDASATVLVLDKTQRIAQRQLVTGLETSSRIEVISGLEDGEMIVLGGRGRYQPGQVATPKLLVEGPSK